MTSAFAQQTVVQNKDLDSFSSVVIGEKFSFRLKSAPNFSVRIIADDRIIDYVRPTVKNGVFTITLNEKKYPAELKKALKAKGDAYGAKIASGVKYRGLRQKLMTYTGRTFCRIVTGRKNTY